MTNGHPAPQTGGHRACGHGFDIPHLGVIREIEMKIQTAAERLGHPENDVQVPLGVQVVVRDSAHEVPAHPHGLAHQVLRSRLLLDAFLGENDELKIRYTRVFLLERQGDFHSQKSDDGVDLHLRAKPGGAVPDAHAQRAFGALHDVSFRDGLLERQRDGDGVFERAGKIGLALFQKRLVQMDVALHERGQHGAAAQIDFRAGGPVLDPRRYSRKPAPGDAQVHQWAARIDSGVPENSIVRYLCAHDYLTGMKHHPDRYETRIAHNRKTEKLDFSNSIFPRRFSPAKKAEARKIPFPVSLTHAWNRGHNEALGTIHHLGSHGI